MGEHEFADARAAQAPWLPSVPHAATHAARVARARQRFFDEGIRPTGLVSEAILQSWMRCAAGGRAHRRELRIESVSALRLDTVLRRSRPLIEAAQGPLRELERQLASTGCHVLLIEPHGLIVHASPSCRAVDKGLSPRVMRPGVDVSEHLLGTNAPAVALKTGRACSVGGGEHFFEQIGVMHCAAAPIRDAHGRMAGVLNLVLEQQPFRFDAGLLVRLQAAVIERQLLLFQSARHTLVEIHVLADSLGRPEAGLVALDEAGRIAWRNARSRQFIDAVEQDSCEEVLGLKLPSLWQLAGQAQLACLVLPNGLCVWARVRLPLDRAETQEVTLHTEAAAQVQASPCPPEVGSASPSPSSLAEQERDILRRTLQECRGNISQVARRLGISRGRIYRYLAQTPEALSAKDAAGR